MKSYRILAVIAVLAGLLAAACAGPQTREPMPSAAHESALREPPMELYPAPAPKTEGAIYSDTSRANMYTDVKAARVGDIVTINVVETSRASKEAATSLGREHDLELGIDALFGLEGALGGAEYTPSTALGLAFENDLDGSGRTSRSETMTAQISARVVKVLPNGNMVVRGSREITLNYEKQYIIIQGVVRPEDVSPNNTIQSNYLADARIEYTGKGDISRQQRKGWLSRALDYVWPF